MIGSSDREQALAQLCAALDGWGLVYGHTHEPHVAKRQVLHLRTGEERTVLLGNCGSFRRKNIPPTWIESAFPSLALWAYNADRKQAELLDRIALTPQEMLAYAVSSAEAAAASVA
ncbi:MAG TPA: hypothetical protein VMS17_21210 [Gemmataceae bacterium]|nr:hypothetical protein [Gemmataceae bacterium]